jgi:hypothetical protein
MAEWLSRWDHDMLALSGCAVVMLLSTAVMYVSPWVRSAVLSVTSGAGHPAESAIESPVEASSLVTSTSTPSTSVDRAA